MRLIPAEKIKAENPALVKRLGKNRKEGFVIEAAHPIRVGGRIVGALYGAVLLNNNTVIVDQHVQPAVQGAASIAAETSASLPFIKVTRRSVLTLKGKDGQLLLGTRGRRANANENP